MKTVMLIPYCPIPADTGGKSEMWQHARLLREMGECKVVSARSMPVGRDWTPDSIAQFRQAGIELVFREDFSRGWSMRQTLGVAYAVLFKRILRMESAFGHSNPYHRYAFPADWWRRQTESADLAFVNYSYWAWLPCACPKVVILLDVWSNYMRLANRRETADLRAASLVVVISKDEETTLRQRGVTQTIWSPPYVRRMEFPDSSIAGLVGSASEFNIEGLNWLSGGPAEVSRGIRIYGGLASRAQNGPFTAVGRYDDSYAPYRDCGIVLMTTVEGMGVQIKSVEALACGRAIIARKGAMRGLPAGEGAWLEVTSAAEMMKELSRLRNDAPERRRLGRAAHNYYDEHLDTGKTADRLRAAYRAIVGRSYRTGSSGQIRGPQGGSGQ